MNLGKAVLIVCACLIAGFSSTAPAAAVEGVSGDNPLKQEMRLLDSAFKSLIDDIVLNNLQAIEGHFQELHAAKEKTREALKKGEIGLPKNGEKMKLFARFDSDFHAKLEVLIKASKKGDMKVVKGVTHRLLNGCVRCHGVFRQ